MLLIIHFIKHFRQLNVHVRGPLYNVHTMSIRMGHWINPVSFRSTQSFSLFDSIRPNIVHIIYSTHMCVLVACTTHRSTTMKPERKNHMENLHGEKIKLEEITKREAHTHTYTQCKNKNKTKQLYFSMFFLLVIFLPHFTCVWVIVQCFLAVFSLLLLFLLLFLFLWLLSGCGVFHCKNDSSILLAEKRFANALFNTSCHGIIHNSVFFCALTKLLWFSFFVFLLAFILYLNRTRSVSFVLSIGWFFFTIIQCYDATI